MTARRPLVAVLLATHQGARYLEEQLATILGQRGVEVRLVVSDDGSTDRTLDILAAHADDPRMTLLPAERFGTPQGNFLRLVRDADVTGADAVAFADQDDRWHLDKLERQLSLLADHDAAAVSSDVVAFWGDERVPFRTRLVEKSQPQRQLDFLLESAGPGCTFVVAADAFARVAAVVRDHPLVDERVPHDWLVYAIVRALGMRWHIDDEPTLDYRQHGQNATGANHGVRQAVVRVRKLANGEYRRQCAAVAALAAAIATGELRARLQVIAPLLARRDRAARHALLRLASELRRNPVEQRALRLALALGLW